MASKHATPRAADDTPVPLEWKTFCERYFPGRRRHDHEAIAAYAAYRVDWAPGR